MTGLAAECIPPAAIATENHKGSSDTVGRADISPRAFAYLSFCPHGSQTSRLDGFLADKLGSFRAATRGMYSMRMDPFARGQVASR